MTEVKERPIWAQYSEEGEAKLLAKTMRMKASLNATVRAEAARFLMDTHGVLPRWRWFRRRRIVRALKELEREELAYRG